MNEMIEKRKGYKRKPVDIRNKKENAVKMKIQTKRNIALRKLDRAYKIDINCVKLNANNTDGHELKKYEVCRTLNKEGCHFVTEAIFKEGGRADVYCLDTNTVIEILCTERMKDLRKKINSGKYPGDVKFCYCRTSGIRTTTATYFKVD